MPGVHNVFQHKKLIVVALSEPNAVMYSNADLMIMIIANLSEAAATCDSSLCDPFNTPAGYFCSMDSVFGCGLICVDLDVCAPETLPIMIVLEKQRKCQNLSLSVLPRLMDK